MSFIATAPADGDLMDFNSTLCFNHHDILAQATRVGDANRIHFPDGTLKRLFRLKGTPVQQGLIQPTLEGELQSFLFTKLHKIAVLYHIDLYFLSYVYADIEVNIKGTMTIMKRRREARVVFQGNQIQTKGIVICFKGEAELKLFSIPHSK